MISYMGEYIQEASALQQAFFSVVMLIMTESEHCTRYVIMGSKTM